MAVPFPTLFSPAFLITLLLLLFVPASLRILTLLRTLGLPPRNPPKKGAPVHLMIVLGSGGHTQEMLYMLERLVQSYKYTYRTYVLSSGDALSADRARTAERDMEARENERGCVRWGDVKEQMQAAAKQGMGMRDLDLEELDVERENGWPLISHTGPETYTIATVPRARKIHQSLLTTPVSALQCLWGCLCVLLNAPSSTIAATSPATTSNTPSNAPSTDPYITPSYPDILLCNGPATAVIMVLAAWILKFFDVRGAASRDKMKVVYVESFARVKGLSLSGRLLVRFVDHFYVQWPQLAGSGGGRARYVGFLVI